MQLAGHLSCLQPARCVAIPSHHDLMACAGSRQLKPKKVQQSLPSEEAVLPLAGMTWLAPISLCLFCFDDFLGFKPNAKDKQSEEKGRGRISRPEKHIRLTPEALEISI